MHSTNYRDTLIEIAEDTKALQAQTPPQKGDKKTVANMQFEMMAKFPYRYTSDELIFGIFAERNGISNSQREKAHHEFFSKGQACLRTSPLAKTYGWGIHHNAESKVALYAMESEEYQRLLQDSSVQKGKAMRSKRK